MKIRVKIGEVEIEYTKETGDDSANAATCEDGWSGGANHEKLIATVREISKQAKELHDGMYK